ncbi:MAG TPA: hypothetical protein VIM29_08465 [Bacillota bacterium]
MRKKLIIPVLTMISLLMLASSTLAVNTFSVNTFFNGNTELGNTDYDLSQLTFGLTVPLDKKVSIGAELASGDIERYSAYGDTFSYRIKGAYNILADRKFKLDLTGGVYHRSFEYPHDWSYSDYEINSLFVGVDGRLLLDPKAWIDLGLAIGLLPDEKLDLYTGQHRKGNPDSLVLFNFKFNYLLNKQLGLTVGYTSETYNSERLAPGNSHTGLSLSGFYRF